ncbi:MAG: ribosome maturation factor RimM [Oscillatoriales cyanobacterium C42_A2020_001]|nr:ribosome maturation factor RimM [Leptolyngbyaceae cyanobacterium C42_A2020_001]
MTESFVEIGKIVAPQGLKGELRVYPNSDFPERFLQPGQRWLLHPGDHQPRPITLLKGRYLDGKGLYIVQLENITDRDQAETLRDCKLMVPASDRLPLEEGEFHVADLIGLGVFDQTNQTLVGEVINVLTAGNDLLEVKRSQSANAEKTKTALIPFVKAIVPVVDLKQGRIEITPPNGLLD